MPKARFPKFGSLRFSSERSRARKDETNETHVSEDAEIASEPSPPSIPNLDAPVTDGRDKAKGDVVRERLRSMSVAVSGAPALQIPPDPDPTLRESPALEPRLSRPTEPPEGGREEGDARLAVDHALIGGIQDPTLQHMGVPDGAPVDRTRPDSPMADEDGAAVVSVELLDEPVSEHDFESEPPSIPSAAGIGSAPTMLEPPSEQQVSEPALPGQLIADRYEVRSVLGEGGMGIVYYCRDRVTGERVAVKRVIVPLQGLAHEYMMWFYKEARALAALDHPAIVRALDFGQLLDGSPYLAMDLVTGVSLHDLMPTRLPFPVIWTIVDQILSALAHAHARGIIHGDLKPSNVLIEPGKPPQVRILDFGLAWLRQDPHDERLDGNKAQEVAPHAGAGTPGYMAPEQIMHEQHHVCGATDLYSLGCILYKLFTGHAPFSGTSKELLRSHAYQSIPPPELVIEAPQEVIGFVQRLLRKRPWERWAYAEEARAEWKRLRPSEPTDPSVWKLPRAATVPKESIRTAQPERNPRLSPVQERAPGLLSMRASPLVGHTRIRRQLRDLCSEVIAGKGARHRLVVLAGPSGVGKSRIAEWLCEVVHEEGTMVALRARYRPIRGPLDGMGGAVTQFYNFERVERDTIEESLLARWNVDPGDQTGRAWVAGAAEWLRPLGPMSDHPIGPSGIRFTLDTLETRRTVARYTLRRIANGRPLLLWLDDLHHASPTTIEGLVRMHHDDPDQPFVLVVTAKSEELSLSTPGAERLRQLRDHLDGTVIDVPPMDERTTQQLLRASLPLDDAAVREAARRSRGNPLFALQQLHAWALDGSMQLSEGVYRVPDDVLALKPKTTTELWDSRVGAMPEEQRLAPTAAAALGSDIRHDVLVKLLAALEIEPEPAIESMTLSEVLIPRGTDRYVWPHALLQEHLLEGLSAREDCRRIFQAAATALASHPLAWTRRIVRLRVHNLLYAGEAETAARLSFDFVQDSWYGAREPLATLADLEVLTGLKGRLLAQLHRWKAEALRHVGRNEKAGYHAEVGRRSFEALGDPRNMAHCLRLLGHLASERGNSTEGLKVVAQAYAVFEELDDTQGLAQCEAVAGEVEYLLGHNASARSYIQRGQEHFAALRQPLGRGQCLLLASWIEHSEGAAEKSRKLSNDARAEFEHAGYRLGIAQANASVAHVEHRVMNYHTAEQVAVDALIAFETLQALRGQAACERLLCMLGIDTDDLDMSELHAERARRLYGQMNDPWGIMEIQLLRAQIALIRHDRDDARTLLDECAKIVIEEAEPRQHYFLTLAWLEASSGDLDRAFQSIETASSVFAERLRAGDHTPHLLSRLSRYEWPEHAADRLDTWRTQLNDRARRRQL